MSVLYLIRLLFPLREHPRARQVKMRCISVPKFKHFKSQFLSENPVSSMRCLKGPNSKTVQTQLWFLCFSCRLLLLNNCMKFHQDLLNCFQDIVPKRFCRKLLFYKVQRDISKTYKEKLLFLCYLMIFV